MEQEREAAHIPNICMKFYLPYGGKASMKDDKYCLNQVRGTSRASPLIMPDVSRPWTSWLYFTDSRREEFSSHDGEYDKV